MDLGKLRSWKSNDKYVHKEFADESVVNQYNKASIRHVVMPLTTGTMILWTPADKQEEHCCWTQAVQYHV